MNNCYTCKWEPKWSEEDFGKKGICQKPLPIGCTRGYVYMYNESKHINGGFSPGAGVYVSCPAYVEDYVKVINTEAKEHSSALIARKAPVKIYHNDEAGDWQWTIQDANDLDFWLASFETEQEVIGFCEKHALPIVEVIK